MNPFDDDLVQIVREFRSSPNLELEGKLGIISATDTFQTGVSFSYFKELFDSFAIVRKTDETSDNNWTNFQDVRPFARFYFKDQVRGSYTGSSPPVFIRKRTISNLDIQCTDRVYDIRVSLSEELPLPGYVPVVSPDRVRLVERWSFEYKNIWRYDFSKVATGASKQSACKSLPVFEVELELLHRTPFLDKVSDTELVAHITGKLTDLLGRFDSHHRLLPLHLEKGKIWRCTAPATGVV